MELNLKTYPSLALNTGFFQLIIISTGFFLASCHANHSYIEGNGKKISELRPLEKFEILEIDGIYDVLLKEGELEAIEIETDENLIGLITSQVQGNKLEVFDSKKINSNEPIKITITYRNLNKIVSAGASTISSFSPLSSGSIFVKMKGAGYMNLGLNADSLDVSLSGAGLIKLSGKVKKQVINLSGAGNLNAYNLQSKDCKINLSGIGGAQIFVEEQLKAQISGIGGINYKGFPGKVEKIVEGFGRIKCVDKK